ncbi:TetR/AcrR family transcriptional regulator [Nocardioides jejuensis]|uniref:TetR/AcrR family transcriptional regulator n=1 Tax=Nocardioides jejuensis TaxID=2502782 RepID=UPI001FB3C863|nr:TetR/AcrR family transcriptional regulator [Nocardioides jejuensis]
MTYHHGDLRATLLATAMEMLEEGTPFSLRALARRAGVSQTAPYRHFDDRDALEAALAADGFVDLKVALVGDGDGIPATVNGLIEFAVAYVHFALRRPAVFRLMFGNECTDSAPQVIEAAQELRDLLATALHNLFEGDDLDALATACWALVHGLAVLHLDGKLDASDLDATARRVRTTFAAVLSAGAIRATGR